MFDHVKFGVSDYAASKAFFLKALAPLGVGVIGEGTPAYGVELSAKGKASLCLYESTHKRRPDVEGRRRALRGRHLGAIPEAHRERTLGERAGQLLTERGGLAERHGASGAV